MLRRVRCPSSSTSQAPACTCWPFFSTVFERPGGPHSCSSTRRSFETAWTSWPRGRGGRPHRGVAFGVLDDRRAREDGGTWPCPSTLPPRGHRGRRRSSGTSVNLPCPPISSRSEVPRPRLVSRVWVRRGEAKRCRTIVDHPRDGRISRAGHDREDGFYRPSAGGGGSSSGPAPDVSGTIGSGDGAGGLEAHRARGPWQGVWWRDVVRGSRSGVRPIEGFV